MEDKWFTSDELKRIQKLAYNISDLKNENVINLGSMPTSILNVSAKHELILPQGNTSTGFEHINERHNFFSFTPYWKEDNNGKMILDNPSRFSPKLTPILDYIIIADMVFEGELNEKECNNPHAFDMYSKEIEYKGSKQSFNLLIYKGTKIIHALHPLKSTLKRKKPKKFHFFRGGVEILQDYKNDTIEINIPYKNHKDIIQYAILLVKNFYEKKETASVIIHDYEGKPTGFVEIGTRDLKEEYEKINPPKISMEYQVSDLPIFEEWIKYIDEQQKKSF
ncbi:MAG: hypothetical protein MUE72_02575 [Chitinophagaceae bacterium]|nr:hypothetical protein [Chitinophagaceae bacterium]